MAEFMSGSVKLDELLCLPDDEELKFVVRDCSPTSTSSTYSSVVYLSRHLMTQHEISYGDPKVLRGSGGRQTACTVIPDLQEETIDDDFPYQIRLTSVIQNRLEVDVGDSVAMLNSEKIRHGKVVWISPVHPVQERSVDLEMENLLETYLVPYFWRAYRLVCEGDGFDVTRSGKIIKFQVTKTDPSSFCIVAPGTVIRCVKIVSKKESKAAGRLPSPKEGPQFEPLLKTMPSTITKRAAIKASSSSKRRLRVTDRKIIPSSMSAAGQRCNFPSDKITRETESETSIKVPALPLIINTPKWTKPRLPIATPKIVSTQLRLAKFMATTVEGIRNCLAHSTPIKSCTTDEVHLDAGDYNYSSNIISSVKQGKREPTEQQLTPKTSAHQLLKPRKPVQNSKAIISRKCPVDTPAATNCITTIKEKNNCVNPSNMFGSSATNLNKCSTTSPAHDGGATDQFKADVSSVLLAKAPQLSPVSVRKPLLETLETVASSLNDDGFLPAGQNISNICQSKVKSTADGIQKVLPRELLGCSEHLISTKAKVSDSVKNSTECERKQRIINDSAVSGDKYLYQIQQKVFLPPQPERITQSYQPYRIPRKIQPAPPIIAPIQQLVKAQPFNQAIHGPQSVPLNPGAKPWNPPLQVVEPLPRGGIGRICLVCTKRNVRGNLRHRYQQCPHRRIFICEYLQLLRENRLCPRCRGNPYKRHPMPGVCPWAAMLDGDSN